MKKCDPQPEPRWIALERDAAEQAAWLARFAALLDVAQLRRLEAQLRECLASAARARPHRSTERIAALRRAAGLPRQPAGVLVSRP